ncbi:MAG: hypothetical protein SFY92_05405 [Verrucomicrobiae bacterium]|nr:hypothetical protein [Verrucomicrobiae bacterium]
MSDPIPNTSEAKSIMGYSFLHVFAKANRIDQDELAFIERLALRDGLVDENEKQILHNIFSRVSQETEPAEVWEEICRFKKQFGIG